MFKSILVAQRLVLNFYGGEGGSRHHAPLKCGGRGQLCRDSSLLHLSAASEDWTWTARLPRSGSKYPGYLLKTSSASRLGHFQVYNHIWNQILDNDPLFYIDLRLFSIHNWCSAQSEVISSIHSFKCLLLTYHELGSCTVVKIKNWNES